MGSGYGGPKQEGEANWGEEEFHMGSGGGGDLLGGWGPCGMRGCPHWKVALCVMSRVS